MIPEAICGILTCHFLCKPCNDRLGHEFEAGVKRDAVIRLAMRTIRPRIPTLIDSMSARLEAIAESPRGPVRGHLTAEGDFRVRESQEPDRSLIQPSDSAQRNIAHMMRQNGRSEQETDEALARFAAAPENERIEIAPGYEIIKWGITKIEPALDAPPVSAIVPLKIAYEYLALHLGTAVLDPGLGPVRGLLRNESTPLENYRIERFVALPYAPFHGLVLEKNAPHAVVQIRLFGGAVFRVHFAGIAVGGVRMKYTHDLEKGQDGFRAVDA